MWTWTCIPRSPVTHSLWISLLNYLMACDPFFPLDVYVLILFLLVVAALCFILKWRGKPNSLPIVSYIYRRMCGRAVISLEYCFGVTIWECSSCFIGEIHTCISIICSLQYPLGFPLETWQRGTMSSLPYPQNNEHLTFLLWYLQVSIDSGYGSGCPARSEVKWGPEEVRWERPLYLLVLNVKSSN